MSATATTAQIANPYVGPRSFTREHRLYGRDRELRDLTSLLVAERIVLLHSPSGAGKSSLIQAALIPALEARQFSVLPIIRVGLAPPGALPAGGNRYLASAALAIAGDDAAGQPLADLLAAHDAASGQPDTVLIFDQFEELLTVDPLNVAAKEEFCQAIGDLLRANRRLWALFVIREDYLAPLMPYAHPLPSRLRITFRLDLLDAAGALAAVRQPALAAGVDFSPDAATSLVDDLRRARVQRADDEVRSELGPTVEPVQLQVVCYRLWQRLFGDAAPPGAQISSDSLGAVGTVGAALADYYAERVAAAAAASGVRERAIRDWFERQLITPGSIRSQVMRGAGATAGLPNAALPPLVNAYLIRAEQRRNFTWYELAHDRLIEPVRESNAAWLAGLSPIQRQAALWESSERPPGLLLRDAELVAARTWAAAHPGLVEPIDEEFLADCAAQQARLDADRAQQRLIRRLAIAATALALVMIVAAGIALLSYQEAARQSRLARARELAAEAVVNLPLDPQLSLSLARQAVLTRTDAGEPAEPSALATLYQALAASRVRETIALAGLPTGLAVSPDGRWIAVGLLADDGSAPIELIDRADGSRRTLSGHSETIPSLAFSPDSATLASVSWDGTLRSWDVASAGAGPISPHPDLARREDLDDPDAVRLLNLAFDPAGASIYTVGNDGWLRRWDRAGGAQSAIGEPSESPLLAIAISPAGDEIATAGNAGDVVIWRLADGEIAREQPVGPQQITGLAYAADGELLIGEGARLSAIAGADTIATLATFSSSLNDLSLSPDGTLALLASSDGSARMVAIGSGRTLLTLSGHTDQIMRARWLPDGSSVVTIALDGSARVWDLSTQLAFTPTALAGDPAGGWAAAGGEDGTIALLGPLGGAPRPLLHHVDAIELLAFSADGRYLAAASADGEATIWQVADGQLLAVIPHEARVRTAALSADGSTLLTTSGREALLWRWAAGEAATQIARFSTAERSEDLVVTGAALHPSQPWVAIVQRGGPTILWDYAADTVLATAAEPAANGRVGFSPDGALLLSESSDGPLLLRRSADLSPVALPADHRGGVFGFAFSPDSAVVATIGADNAARLWRIADGRELLQMGSDGPPAAVAFSGPGELLLATASGVARLPTDPAAAMDLAAIRQRSLSDDECSIYDLASGTRCGR